MSNTNILNEKISEYFRSLARKSWEVRKKYQDKEFFSRIGKIGGKKAKNKNERVG